MPAPSTKPWVISAPVATTAWTQPRSIISQSTSALLGDRHRARDRDDPEAVGIPDHCFEGVGGLAEAPAAEGGARHAPDEGVDAVRGAEVEGLERLETVVVSRSVPRFVADLRHEQLLRGRGERASTVAKDRRRIVREPALLHRRAMLEVVLEPGRDRSLRRRHPWVLSGAVGKVLGEPEPGAWTRVVTANGEVLGFGHFSPASSIRVRMLAFGPEDPGESLLATRIAEAVARRADDPLLAATDAVRLVNAEGDGLPGLVVDRFADACVLKLTSAGMGSRRDAVVAAVREATGAARGFARPDATAARREKLPVESGPLWGEFSDAPIEIHEGERRFEVDVAEGQKTGFYLDQRDARDLVATLAPGARVLDLFSYTGGFAVAAARGGARSVTLVDSSAPALARAEVHLAKNDARCEARLEKADGFGFLRDRSEVWDLLCVDPPPLARSKRDVPRATRAYQGSAPPRVPARRTGRAGAGLRLLPSGRPGPVPQGRLRGGPRCGARGSGLAHAGGAGRSSRLPLPSGRGVPVRPAAPRRLSRACPAVKASPV